MEPGSVSSDLPGQLRTLRTWGSSGHANQQQWSVTGASDQPGSPLSAAGSPRSASQEQSAYSPLSAARTKRRSVSAAGSHDEQPGHQSATGIAYVSLTGAGADNTPRSPSRLRYTFSNAGSPERTSPVVPKFITVEEHGDPGAAVEDVHIQHVQPSEELRQKDLQDKVIKQVDNLVEYFNTLYHDDQLDISTLQQELAGRDLEISQKNIIIQQLLLSRQQQPAAVGDYSVQSDQGLWAAIKCSWQRNTCCWMFSLLLLLAAVVLLVALPIGLSRSQHTAAANSAACPADDVLSAAASRLIHPTFVGTPEFTAATNKSLDFRIAVNKTAVVYYVLIPRNTTQTGLQQTGNWQQYKAADLQTAAAGWGTSGLGERSAACGSLYIKDANINVTFSVASMTSSECSQPRAAADTAASNNCLRCPWLEPEVTYDVLLAAENPKSTAGSSGSSVAHVEATTLPEWAGVAPRARGSAMGVAQATAVGESSFNLTLSMDIAGSMKYLVVYANMYARFMDRYAVFDNEISNATALLHGSRSQFQDGVVARGQIDIKKGQTEYTCTIGGSSGNSCSCNPIANCSQETACFGALCDYSTVSLAPNTTYKVFLVPVSLDASATGVAIQVGPFTTAPSSSRPVPASDMAISPLVGPDRFTIQKLQQNKPGMVHIIVARPFNQAEDSSKVSAGTATAFERVANARSLLVLPSQEDVQQHRQLLQAAVSSTGVYALPSEINASVPGSLFLPPAASQQPCTGLDTVAGYVNQAAEAVVSQKCVAVPKISQASDFGITGLVNDTLYRVVMVHMDTYGNEEVLSALVHTQDLTPPQLTVANQPPPDFNKFSVVLRLDEPGKLYPGLLLSADQAAVTADAACPPTFKGPMVGEQALTVPAANQDITLTFDQGLVANTDYLLKLVAEDDHGNCQTTFTDLLIHTLDNVPPVTLALDMLNITGSSAHLQLTLNEPGIAFYMVMSHGPDGTAPACPSVDQLSGLTVPAAVELPSPSAMGNFSVSSANVPTGPAVTRLQSQTAYRACAVAADDTRLHNRQPAASFKDFTTLDVTPPNLRVGAVPGTDGNFTCNRTTSLCSLTFSTTLNEAGIIAWALVRTSLPATLPTVQQLLAPGQNISQLLPGALASGNINTVAGNTTVTGLASQAEYALLLAAMDAAPQPNYVPQLAQLQLVAPDITPPVFLNVTMMDAGDDNLTLRVTVNEASTVFYVLAEHPSSSPTVTQVVSGKAVGDTTPAAAGNLTAAANASTRFVASGLTAGHFYDVYMVAVDAPAGNMQKAVTNLTAIRTTDSSPPVINSLLATFTLPMTFTITANISKPGSILYAPRKVGDPAPTVQEVLSAWESGDPALANFTGRLDFLNANAAATGTACVADGDQLVVYAVAQDGEGLWPGRHNNTSPVSSAVVHVIAPDLGSSCIAPAFLAPLQPSLGFAALGSQDPRLTGLMLGSRTNSSSETGMTWQQNAAAFMYGSATQPVQLLAKAAGVKLPGSIGLDLTPYPPAAVKVIMRSTLLVPDAHADEGSTLLISYQLTDAAGRAQVDVSGITIKPVLSYATGATAPTGTAASNNVLPACDLAQFGRSSGIGDCSAVVGRKFFPASGSLAATIVLKIMAGATELAASAAANVQLQAPPSTLAFTPSIPGVLITMPYRPVYFGESIKVTVEAINPLVQGVTGFVVPLRFDAQRLHFTRAVTSSLWMPVTVNQRGVQGSYDVVELSVAGRAGSNPDTAYHSSSSIPLVEVFFTVAASLPGLTSVLSIDASGPFSLNHSWNRPPYQINSVNGPSDTTTGSLNVVANTILGMWAWADAYDVLNTAALTGNQISTAVRGALVKSYGTIKYNIGDTVSSCLLPAGTTAANAAMVNGVCQVLVNAVNTATAKGLAVTISLDAAMQTHLSAQVKLNFWYPTNLILSAADTTLNSVLPINAAPTSPSCMDKYQSTPVMLTADWSNGGASAEDKLLAADITDMVSFVSNDSNVVQVSGAVAKGVRPGTASISASATGSPKLAITVSNQPVCLKQLHVMATTGAALTQQTATALSSSPAKPTSGTALAWEARQDLVWENSSALVLTYASFTDGGVMDVSRRADVTAAVLVGATAQLPFALSTDNTTQTKSVSVNVKVGTATSCQKYLQASWSVCSLPLGTGSGTVHVQLPNPTAIANFTATPSSIASATNGASQAPVRLAIESKLAVLVAFGDGRVWDFSRDTRTTFSVSQGSTICAVQTGSDGISQVVATGPSASGQCRITATVSFANSSTFTASVTVLVVAMTEVAIAALDVNTIALPQPLLPSQLLLDDTMVLLKCDARNYEQRTIWSFGVLSNCTNNASCPLIDINNRQQINLASSNTAVAQVMSGFPAQTSYPTYPLLGNRLVPFAAGTTSVASTFNNGTSTSMTRSITVSVKDTFQPSWPAAAAIGDTSVLVQANMSETYTVTYQLVPSSQLNLASDPPTAYEVETAGVAMVADEASGSFALSATTANLIPGTNYTLLTAVRQGLVLSPGVTALTGLLVPDTTPPSFTKNDVLSAAVSSTQAGKFNMQLDLGLNEPGRVYYAVYGDPACIIADPTPAEIASGVNLADVNKCSCSSRYCAAAATGVLVFNGSVTADKVSITAAEPPFVFDDLPLDATCINYTPRNFSSIKHAMYLLAEDDLPTYKNWNNSCSMPVVDQSTPPTPCAPVTIGRCSNTPPARGEQVNQQATPYATVDLHAKATAPAIRPLKGVVTVTDPVAAGFAQAGINSTGVSIVFTFQTTKPGLVQWRLVEQVTVEIANGYVSVRDTSVRHEVAVSRKCSGTQLVLGTSYAMWYNMTDVYGHTTDISILKIVM